MKTDVLILSYNAHGRDFEAFMLLKYHLEHSFHLTVHLKPVRDLYWIDRLRPTVLVVTDTKNPSNIVAARYARQCGILVTTIEGEGIFNPAFGEEMIWGWNTQRELIEHLRLQWSERNRRYLVERCPELADTIVVTGGGRFDRYRIYRFKNKSELLDQYGKSTYKHVIGYAGWGFSNLSSPAKRSYQVFLESFTQEQLDRVLQDRATIARWLNQMVHTYPNVLFVLKQHPGDDGSFTEIVLDRPYENVLRLKNEEKVEDIINACDLWIDYTSTTSLEAWLLDKPTCSFVPSDTSFLRMGYERGSIQIHNDQELMRVIGDFVQTGELSGFDELAAVRQHLIKTYIGWGDGFNSLRAAKAIVQLMELKGPRSYQQAPMVNRLRNAGRHIVRCVLTLNGKRETRVYGLRSLLTREGRRKVRSAGSDGFVQGRIAHVQSVYYPQIEAFIAAHWEMYERVKNNVVV